MRHVLAAALVVLAFPATGFAACTVGASKCVRERMEYCQFCYGAVAAQTPCWKRSSEKCNRDDPDDIQVRGPFSPIPEPLLATRPAEVR